MDASWEARLSSAVIARGGREIRFWSRTPSGCSKSAAPAASSPPWTARRSPACSPQLAHRPPAAAPGPALANGRTAGGPAPGAGCSSRPQLPESWGTGSPFLGPSSLLPLLRVCQLATNHRYTHSRAPPRLPAAGGWRALRPLASFVALLLPFAIRCRRAVGFQAPSRTRPKAQGGKLGWETGRLPTRLGAASVARGAWNSQVKRSRGGPGLGLVQARSVQRAGHGVMWGLQETPRCERHPRSIEGQRPASRQT